MIWLKGFQDFYFREYAANLHLFEMQSFFNKSNRPRHNHKIIKMLSSRSSSRYTKLPVAVSGIKKKQLAEVRSMANPPAIVKLALESICLLLDGNEIADWKAIRSTLNKDSFIPSIVNFDTLSLTYDISIIFLFIFVSFAFYLYIFKYFVNIMSFIYVY